MDDIFQPLIAHFELTCPQCGQVYDSLSIQTFASCSNSCAEPLWVKYHLPIDNSKESVIGNENSMWRYNKMLPQLDDANRVSLGEGMTPIHHMKRWGSARGFSNVYMKDESSNPTGSFKARGLSMAVSKAKELGIRTCIIPTAGNAGGAMSAYCAKAGIRAIVVMPRHTPEMFKRECEFYGAELVLVDGLISDCGRKVREIQKSIDAFDVSTLKEPYRLEGKKTMGYEIAEQLNWELPDIILYPTGGGTGLIGIWKAFQEMIELGWIQEKNLPRMVAIQAENCQPIVYSWRGLHDNSKHYAGRPSLANGLSVPHPFGEKLILKALRDSGGTAMAISDEEMLDQSKEVARREGLFIAPEGGALFAALEELANIGFLYGDEKILLINTGSGYKYMENFTR